MSNRLALRLAPLPVETPSSTYDWLPEESPIAMPRQTLEALQGRPERAPATAPATIARRRLILLASTLALTVLSLVVPVILMARGGFTALELTGLGLFVVLIASLSCWFSNALIGFTLLMQGRDQDDLAFAAHPAAPTTRTALLMPLYNEDADAALARLAALDSELARHGVSDAFDLFVLSDSRKADAILAEAGAFASFRMRAHSRAFYRRREFNTEAKAGNIHDWTTRFGGAYDFMVILDADSTMAGDTVMRLVDAMERNPGVGLIQTAPTIVNAQTLFARMSQFGVRMYGRVAAAGLAWWTGSEGGYWGHNAILRVKAFADCCGLPTLEGRKPFGGHIMSHDSMEAALLRRGGWAVHVTAALDGSNEETPPTIVDFIRRDHRWCQGNLQHLAFMGSTGLTRMNRLQLVMGCLAYVASPLWLASLLVGLIIQLQQPIDWASFWYILHPEFSPFMLASLLSGVMLIGPKFLGTIITLRRPREVRAFGGKAVILKGLLTEVVLSIVVAPILMIANTKAVLKILCGFDAGWGPQNRDAEGLAWSDAFRAMRWQMAAGLAFVVALGFRPDLAVLFAPIVLPLLLAAPIAVWTSRSPTGSIARFADYLIADGEQGEARGVNVVRMAPAAA